MAVDMPSALRQINAGKKHQFYHTILHELVHLFQAQNSYFANVLGRDLLNHSDGYVYWPYANWFSEGLAEFLGGGDNRLKSNHAMLVSANYPDPIQSLVDSVGPKGQGRWAGQNPLGPGEVGDGQWDFTIEYSGGIIAVRYLDYLIKQQVSSLGIKHLTLWMKDQFDNKRGDKNSGLDQYIAKFFNGKTSSNVSGQINSSTAFGLKNFKNTNSFLSDFASNGKQYANDSRGMNFASNVLADTEDSDQGAYTGVDSGGSTTTGKTWLIDLIEGQTNTNISGDPQFPTSTGAVNTPAPPGQDPAPFAAPGTPGNPSSPGGGAPSGGPGRSSPVSSGYEYNWEDQCKPEAVPPKNLLNFSTLDLYWQKGDNEGPGGGDPPTPWPGSPRLGLPVRFQRVYFDATRTDSKGKIEEGYDSPPCTRGKEDCEECESEICEGCNDEVREYSAYFLVADPVLVESDLCKF
jgi:hypothetical protein